MMLLTKVSLLRYWCTCDRWELDAFSRFGMATPHFPVPERLTVCGLVAALSAISSTAARLPFAVGVNVTLTVQLLPAASVVPQVVAD